MPSINLLDPSLGIQTIMESPAATRGGIPEARPLASNVLREAGLEELYSPCNAHHLVEQALCPDAGDGDILRPEVFSGNLAGCLEALKDSDDPAVRALADGELAPLLQNKELLTPTWADDRGLRWRLRRNSATLCPFWDICITAWGRLDNAATVFAALDKLAPEGMDVHFPDRRHARGH